MAGWGVPLEAGGDAEDHDVILVGDVLLSVSGMASALWGGGAEC